MEGIKAGDLSDWIEKKRAQLDNEESNVWAKLELGTEYFMGANRVLNELQKFIGTDLATNP